MRFISHLDLMRLIMRAARRGDLPLYYTEGFSPHPKLRMKEIDPNKEDEVKRWDFSEDTKDNSSSNSEESKISGHERYPVGDKFYVNCTGCDREIEFGWSQPNRGGRIYPIECSDFIPEKVWPDPKYMNVWQQRGWLRKGNTQS